MEPPGLQKTAQSGAMVMEGDICIEISEGLDGTRQRWRGEVLDW